MSESKYVSSKCLQTLETNFQSQKDYKKKKLTDKTTVIVYYNAILRISQTKNICTISQREEGF